MNTWMILDIYKYLVFVWFSWEIKIFSVKNVRLVYITEIDEPVSQMLLFSSQHLSKIIPLRFYMIKSDKIF